MPTPTRSIGVHLNLLPGAHASAEPTPEELAALSPRGARAHARLVAAQRGVDPRATGATPTSRRTRPQTLSYALTDSPVGQLAWIVEKFKEWTDSNDSPEDAVDRDQLLTNVMLYWLTGTAGSSARIYYERAHADGWGDARASRRRHPTALAVFPQDNFIPLRHIADRTENIVRWTEFDRGGHFAAMEEPDLLVGDVRAFFRELRKDRSDGGERSVRVGGAA